MDLEPWLRGTHKDLAAVPRAAIHALELAEEDIARWCGPLTDAEVQAQVFSLPSVGFQLRHIGRSLDRLLTYAEGKQLSERQRKELDTERDDGIERESIFMELAARLHEGRQRIIAICGNGSTLEGVRRVGRNLLPTTVGGLLVHVAEHTQRHVGQAISTAKIVLAQRAVQRDERN